MSLNKQLKPKKFKKYHKIKKNGLKTYTIQSEDSDKKSYSLVSMENGLITVEELNSVNTVLRRGLKKKGFKLKILVDFITTKKPIETRMGKGKGPLDGKVCWVNKGQPIIVFSEMNWKSRITILRSVKKKISISTAIDLNFNNW